MLSSSEIQPLIDAYAAVLRLYACQRCCQAEDAVQEAFIELSRLPKLPSKPKAWLFAVVRRRAINLARSEARRLQRERIAKLDHDEWFEPDVQDPWSEDQAIDWEQQLKCLPGELREIVVAKIWGQQTFNEIATLVGSSSATVHRRYREALQQLQRSITEQFESEHTVPEHTPRDHP